MSVWMPWSIWDLPFVSKSWLKIKLHIWKHVWWWVLISQSHAGSKHNPLTTLATHRMARHRTWHLMPLQALGKWRTEILPKRQNRCRHPRLKRPAQSGTLTYGIVVTKVKTCCLPIYIFDVKWVKCCAISSHGQTKKKLRKFLESMIQKGGKIRQLVREISETYSKSNLLQKLCPQSMILTYIYIYMITYDKYVDFKLQPQIRYGTYVYPLTLSPAKVETSAGGRADQTRLAVRCLQCSDGRWRGWRICRWVGG